MINISQFIAYHADVRPKASALIYGDQIITYREFFDRIEKTGGWLQSRGIGAGEVVALLMKNSPAFLEIAFAVSHIGAVLLPINFRLSACEVAYICGNSEAAMLLVDDELSAGAADVTCPILTVGEDAQADSTKLFDGAPQTAFVPRNGNDLFRLMYTSGTTDRPKGVCHTYDNFYWKSLSHAIGLDLSSATRLLTVGPLYHVGAFDLPGIAVLQHGGTMILLREFDPGAVLAAIEEFRPDGSWMAPIMTSQLLERAPGESRDLSSLRWVVAGGERTPAARVKAFAATFPAARYVDAYGLTETCSGDTLMPPGYELSKAGSAGKAVAHVELSIRDDAGALLPSGEEGEICIRGPKVFKQYWRDAKKTAISFHGDWFRSGDVGRIDEEGFLYLTDRKKDMIISGGENIAASEIERALYEHPAVLDAAVIGVPDAKWGERPVAHVVLAQGASAQADELVAHCRTRLAGFKVPSSIVFRESLPRNPSGKILKRVLREDVASA